MFKHSHLGIIVNLFDSPNCIDKVRFRVACTFHVRTQTQTSNKWGTPLLNVGIAVIKMSVHIYIYVIISLSHLYKGLLPSLVGQHNKRSATGITILIR